jgi:predicted nucleic acid-binding Zn ribbon protein
MAIQIPNHAHCGICGKAVPFGDKTCGAECQAKLDDLNKRRKRTMYMMYGLMALAMGVLALSLVRPGLLGV